jgi:hypothetical protein
MPVERKLYTRTVKFIITAAVALAAIVAVERLKYGDLGGWETAVTRLWHNPRGPILFFVFSSIFLYDYLSISAFNLGFEKESDEFQWYAKGSDEKLPRELKILTYPFALLVCFFVLYGSI